MYVQPWEVVPGAFRPLQVLWEMPRMFFSSLKCSRSTRSHRGCSSILVVWGWAQAAAWAPQQGWPGHFLPSTSHWSQALRFSSCI